MRRFILSIVLALTIMAGGWAVYHKNQIHSLNDALRLANQQWNSFRNSTFKNLEWSGNSRPTIRIASFNIQSFGPAKAGKPTVMNYLAQIIREFDIVAVQEIRSKDQSLLPRFVQQINANGRRYAFTISNRIGENGYYEQYAFIYDQETIGLDAAHSYVVDDPDDLMRREPLVGWFRAKHPSPENAFTFSLVNVHLDSRHPENEVRYLDNLFRAIRNDGRGEDDVIIAGDFNVGDDNLAHLQNRAGVSCLIRDQPTNTRFSNQYDNLLVSLAATSEFTGQSGVYDFLKKFNMTIDEAVSISDHLPVWGEFSIFEGMYLESARATNGSIVR